MNNELAKEGFFFRELDKVTQVLRLILNGLHNEKFELVPALVSLLEVINIPFQLAKSSDELKEVQKMPEVLNSLCDLVLFEVELESDPEGNLTADWETARQ